MLRCLLLALITLTTCTAWAADSTRSAPIPQKPTQTDGQPATVEAGAEAGADASDAPSPAAAVAGKWSKPALIVIDGMIDDGRAAYFKRSLAAAREAGADLIVVRLSTDGGYVHSALSFVEAALAAARESKVHMVALVDGRAWSAGALIAYAHKEIYMMPASHIGDIGIITRGQDGEIKYLPEKIETVMRAQMRTLSEANGWDAAKLVKMTARNQSLFRFTLADGSHRFVIQDDLGLFEAEASEAVRSSKVLIAGEDRLISYTAQEAIDAGMATGPIADLPALWKKLGVDEAQVLDLRPSSSEEWSWSLAALAPLLASLAVLFVILEFKTPGIGIWLILAVICGMGFFVCQYYLDLANALELILVVVGVIIIVVDIFLLPTGGILALIGGGLALFGLLLAFMPDDLQFSPNAVGFGDSLGRALTDILLTIAVATGGIIWLIRVLPGSKAVAHIAILDEITATSAGTRELNAAAIIGRNATVHSDLRPAGSILLDGDVLGATAEHGRYVIAGSAVTVVAMRFGEVIVRPVLTESAT